MKDSEIDSHIYKLKRRKKIAKETGGCNRCAPHGGENINLKGHKPKSDKYKNKRKGK